MKLSKNSKLHLEVQCTFIIPWIVIITLMVVSCNDSYELNMVSTGVYKSSDVIQNTEIISLEEAILLSNRFLCKDKKKGLPATTISYITTSNNTRSDCNICDTIAYIINYNDNQGFTIVSSRKSVYPILAYSTNGAFDKDNSIVKSNFIDNLVQHYLVGNMTQESDYLSEEDYSYCYQSEPIVKNAIGQLHPWNFYVNLEHPDCPVGCVPVAIANVICYCKVTINYKDDPKIQNVRAIAKAIEKGESDSSESENLSLSKRIAGVPVLPDYTYAEAVDKMALLLYYLGKDIGVNYSPTGSGAWLSPGRKVLENLGYNPTKMTKYNSLEALDYLKSDHIIVLTGKDTIAHEQHAWVCDGYSYCHELNNPDQITSLYFHCNWGWSGYCNGYYNPDFFTLPNSVYVSNQMFAVKRDPIMDRYK